MSGPLYLGIKTNNPVIGIVSTNPNTTNAMLSQQGNPTTDNTNNVSAQPQTVVHEMPWHKAHPGLKDIK